MGNSTMSKVMAKEQSSFGLMMDASLLFKAFVMFPNQGTILSVLEPCKGKGSVSVQKVILCKFPKIHVIFQAERVGNVYMLRNSEVTVSEM